MWEYKEEEGFVLQATKSDICTVSLHVLFRVFTNRRMAMINH